MSEVFILVSLAVLALIVVIAVAAAGVAIWTNRKLRADSTSRCCKKNALKAIGWASAWPSASRSACRWDWPSTPRWGMPAAEWPLALQWVSPLALRSALPWSSGTRVRPAR